MDKTTPLKLVLFLLISIYPIVLIKAQVNNVSIIAPPNHLNKVICVDQISLSKEVAAARGLVFTSVLWNVGETITVKFLNGSTPLQDTVKHYAQQWEKYANVHFQFIENGDAKIRIAFEENNLVSWSYIGTRANYVPQHKPTMLLAFDETTTDTVYSRITLHEFGHALGLLHEHQHPEHGIQWNEQAVYDYYSQLGWSNGLIEYYILNKYSTSITQFCEHDTTSIMHYPIPNQFTLDDYEVGLNSTLSAADTFFIKKLYPFELDRNLDSLCVPVIETDSLSTDSVLVVSPIINNHYANHSTILAYPNPIKTGTILSFNLSTESPIELTVFDGNGQLVYHQKQVFGKGQQQFYLKETIFPQIGLYFYSLKVNGEMQRGKLVKL